MSKAIKLAQDWLVISGGLNNDPEFHHADKMAAELLRLAAENVELRAQLKAASEQTPVAALNVSSGRIVVTIKKLDLQLESCDLYAAPLPAVEAETNKHREALQSIVDISPVSLNRNTFSFDGGPHFSAEGGD